MRLLVTTSWTGSRKCSPETGESLAMLAAVCNNHCMNEDELIGTAEAAAILGVDKATVPRWADSDRLPIAARAGAHRNAALLFRRSDIEALKTS